MIFLCLRQVIKGHGKQSKMLKKTLPRRVPQREMDSTSPIYKEKTQFC